MQSEALGIFIQDTVKAVTLKSPNITRYREPLVRWIKADDPQFAEMHTYVHPDLLLPADMLPGAKSVVACFLPFVASIPQANAKDPEVAAEEWARAYVETNRLLKHITDTLIYLLAGLGIRANAEPPTHNFDPVTMKSSWSHKSVAVIAGLGSFGLHQMVITDMGCAGRFTSLVLDAELPELEPEIKERCLYFSDASCTVCTKRCPTGALQVGRSLDKKLCWQRCLTNEEKFKHLGPAGVCGKCATGPCSVVNPVK